jgi:hypothetical protein
MKNRLFQMILLAACLLFAFNTSILAEEEQSGEEQSSEETMTQGNLAIILAQRLGLAPDMPGDLTDIIAINALTQAGYAPREGWNSGSDVTLGMLAGILVQVLGLTAENPEDDASLVEACVAAGIDFSSVSSALASAEIVSLNPSARRTQPTGSQFNDPLLRLPPGDPSSFFSGAGGGFGQGGSGLRPGGGQGGGGDQGGGQGGGGGGGGGSFIPPGPPPMTPN